MREELTNYQEINDWLASYQKEKNETTKKQLQNFIVIACMPLVKKISKGLARRSTDPLDDLIQVGSVGLLKSIKLFNPSVSGNFKAYASYLITGEIRHYLRDKVNIIKAPREYQQLAYRIYQLTQELSSASGEKPTDALIAEHLQMDIKKVHEVIDVERRKKAVSLDQINFSAEDENQNLYDKLADETYEENQNIQETKVMLKLAMSQLSEDLKEIIELNFYDDLTQREIAEKLNISQMQVSRKLKKALNTLFDIIKRDED